MKLVIKGACCDITEKTALAVLYPNRPWCTTLAQARAEEEADRRLEKELWAIEDYDVFSDAYKSLYGVRPRWISPEELKQIQSAKKVLKKC